MLKLPAATNDQKLADAVKANGPDSVGYVDKCGFVELHSPDVLPTRRQPAQILCECENVLCSRKAGDECD